MWDETEETRDGIDVESGEQGFGKPRFDGVWAALFSTDDGIVAFGDARLIAEKGIGRCEKDVLCTVYLRETIDEAIRTYKSEVEKMDEKVEKLDAKYHNYM